MSTCVHINYSWILSVHSQMVRYLTYTHNSILASISKFLPFHTIILLSVCWRHWSITLLLATDWSPYGPDLSNSEAETLNGSTLQNCVLEGQGCVTEAKPPPIVRFPARELRPFSTSSQTFVGSALGQFRGGWSAKQAETHAYRL